MERLLNTAEAAAMLNVKVQTVRLWRITGKSPRYIRIGGSRVMYRLEDIEQWINERTFNNTAAETAKEV